MLWVIAGSTPSSHLHPASHQVLLGLHSQSPFCLPYSDCQGLTPVSSPLTHNSTHCIKVSTLGTNDPFGEILLTTSSLFIHLCWIATVNIVNSRFDHLISLFKVPWWLSNVQRKIPNTYLTPQGLAPSQCFLKLAMLSVFIDGLLPLLMVSSVHRAFCPSLAIPVLAWVYALNNYQEKESVHPTELY